MKTPKTPNPEDLKIINDIKKDFYERWVAPDGLARLDQGDRRGPFDPKFPDTVNNSNGILFLMEFMLLLSLYGALTEEDRVHCNATIERLRGKEVGLFDRHPGQNDFLEAQDNYAAIAANYAITGGRNYARDIVDYGVAHGWCFNNVNPKEYDVRAQRQGGEVAFYAICAEDTPTPWDFIWFSAGCLITLFKKTPDWSTLMLAWFRLHTVGLFDYSEDPLWFRFSTMLLLLIAGTVFKIRWGSIKSIASHYYQPEHPFLRLAEFDSKSL